MTSHLAHNYSRRGLTCIPGDEKERLIQEMRGFDNVRKLDYIWAGMYGQHYAKWLAVFDKTQILVLKTADLNKPDLADKVSNFLNVPVVFNEKVKPRNKTGVSRSKFISSFVTGDSIIKRCMKAFFNPSIRRWLRRKAIYLNTSPKKFEIVISDEMINTANHIYKRDRLLLRELAGVDL